MTSQKSENENKLSKQAYYVMTPSLVVIKAFSFWKYILN